MTEKEYSEDTAKIFKKILFLQDTVAICLNRRVLRSALRIEASLQNFDMVVVFAFSVGFIPYELSLHEFKFLIGQYVSPYFQPKKCLIQQL